MRPKVLSRMFREAFVANIDERYLRGGLGFETTRKSRTVRSASSFSDDVMAMGSFQV